MSTPECADPKIEFIPGLPEALFRIHDVTGSASSTTATMGTGAWLLGPGGTPTFGALGVLLDVILGTALIANRYPEQWGVTASMAVEFCSPIPAGDTALLGQARTVHLSDNAGVAQGLVHTADGTTVAVATQHIRFVPGIPDGHGPAIQPDTAGTDRPILDLLDATAHPRDDGLDLLLSAGPKVANPRGTLHGGIVLCLSEIAASLAVRSEQHPLEPASVHVAYVRPGSVTGTVRFRTQVAYRGRTSAVVRVDCVRPDGKVSAVATLTYRDAR
jgi:uncharacterized protein (TIGR00369 family)